MKSNSTNLIKGIRTVTGRYAITNLRKDWNRNPSIIEKCWINPLNVNEEDEDLLPLRIIKERLLQEKNSLLTVTTEIKDLSKTPIK